MNQKSSYNNPYEGAADRELDLWEKTFDQLNCNYPPTVVARENVTEYLKSQIPTLKVSIFEQTKIAYQIAGLLSAEGVRYMRLDDPILNVLELAGKVELPARHRAKTETWGQLVKLIHQL